MGAGCSLRSRTTGASQRQQGRTLQARPAPPPQPGSGTALSIDTFLGTARGPQDHDSVQHWHNSTDNWNAAEVKPSSNHRCWHFSADHYRMWYLVRYLAKSFLEIWVMSQSPSISYIYWETGHLPSFGDGDWKCNYGSMDCWEHASSKGMTSFSRQKTVTFLLGKLMYLIILYLNPALNSCHNYVHFSHIITTVLSYVLNIFLQIRSGEPADTSYWIPVSSAKFF